MSSSTYRCIATNAREKSHELSLNSKVISFTVRYRFDDISICFQLLNDLPIGVETFTTDMNSHKVVVTGRLDPKKLLKKLKKKTGKRVKIVAMDDKDDESSKDENVLVIDMELIGLGDEPVLGYNDRELEKLMWFSDENPKSICCIS